MTGALRPEVRVTEIGEFIRHHACERRFKLEMNKRRLARRLPFADRLFNALDPVLQEAGREREDTWEQQLVRDGLQPLSEPGAAPGDDDEPSWNDFVRRATVLPVGEAAYAREVKVAGNLGTFHVSGRIDFLVVLWQDGQPRLRLVECKASRRDRTYHRIQVAIYGLLVRQLLTAGHTTVGGVPLGVDAVECVVARIDETTEQSQDILQLGPLDLAIEEADIARLLADDGTLQGIVDTDLDALSYQLDKACDGCVFNVNCLPESARQCRLELIGIDASTARTLRTAGVATLDDLADLDLTGENAAVLRRTPGFAANLAHLRLQA